MATAHDVDTEVKSSDAKDTSSTSSVDVEHSSIQLGDLTVPDGGLKAWLTVFGATLMLFCCGPEGAFGVFQTYYSQHQLKVVSPSTISWITSLQLWVIHVSAVVWGRVFDAHGPRVVLISGSILLFVSTMLVSVCTEYYQFLLVQGLLTGLAYGMLYTPSFASVSTHFRKHRATAAGIVIAGLGVGGVVFPLLFSYLLARIGFGWTMRTWAFLSLILCAIGIATITSNVPPAGRRRTVSRRPVAGRILRDVPFISLVAGCFFVDLAQTVPFTYIASYSISKGVPPSTSNYVLSALNAGAIVGRLALSLIADCVGAFNIISLAAFLLGLLVLVFWMFAESLVAIVAFAVVCGVFIGALSAMHVPCVALISDIKEVGTRIGILYTVAAFGFLAASPTAGAVLKADNGRYTGMISFDGAVTILGALFFLFAKYKINRDIFARV